MVGQSFTREQIIEWLADVADPEIPVLSITDLGIVRDVDCSDGVTVSLTPTYSGCPATEVIESAVAAAEARFELVEIQFREYSAIELKGSAKRQQAALAKKVKLLGELEAAYSEILPYKALDWVIAASFRLGGIYDQFARTLFGAPEPEGLSDDELDVYLTLIEDEGLKYENVAIQRYETTVEQSRRLKVTNEWSKAALKAINRYKPAEYPLFKEEKREVVDLPLYSDTPPTVPAAPGGDG